jgi:hypothetical protein
MSEPISPPIADAASLNWIAALAEALVKNKVFSEAEVSAITGRAIELSKDIFASKDVFGVKDAFDPDKG